MQEELFAEADLACPIEGLEYQPDFLSPEEEGYLLGIVRSLPLCAAQYKQYLARRRVASFGGSFDYDTNMLRPGKPLDERLVPLRDRVAGWLGVRHDELVHALVAEYVPGTPLGWHRDVPNFEVIAGVSLGNNAVLRFRPYPPDDVAKRAVLEMDVAPRSVYKMAGQARWAWQHSVSPVKAMRWSITFRTRR
ncbi:Alkylated DNA repair dioxygenase AlkB [Variovorax sp. YR216]|nr:Alkylated DNA repair dioxygenase AlkB [Variovorax sp. YR216]